MKSTINISISSVAFTLESDAYDAINNYMKQVERAYESDIAASEIISDIEARISELILSWQSEHTTVVTKECIDAIIAQLGIPDEPISATNTSRSIIEDVEKPTTPRRLYRNAQGSRLGGVLNGIATYLNIDVTLLRISVLAIFAACVFIGHNQGTTLPLIIITYIGMWMIIPMAKNARQKMEMQGHPITAESISSNIKYELNSISPNKKNEETASIFTNLIYAIGRLIRFFFMFIASMIGFSVAATIIATIVAGLAIIFKGQDTVRLFIDSDPVLITIIAVVCIIAPLLIISYFIIKMLFSLRWSKAIIFSLLALCVVSWSIGTYTFSSNIYDFVQQTSVNEHKQFSIKSDTLTIIPQGDIFTVNAFDWKAGIIRDRVRFYIEENKALKKNEVKINIRRTSSGSTLDDAITNCNNIAFNFKITGDAIIFPSTLIYKAPETKYRGQNIKIDIEVAPGINVIIPEDYYNRNQRNIFSDNESAFKIESYNNNTYITPYLTSNEIKTQTPSVTEETKIISNSTETSSSVKEEVVVIKNGEITTITNK